MLIRRLCRSPITFRDGEIQSDTRKDAAAAHLVQADAAAQKTRCERVRRRRHRGGLDLRENGDGRGGARYQRNKIARRSPCSESFIGVAAVIAMVAVGDGARASVERRFRASAPI